MEATNIVPFDYEGNEIRTITIDGQPWWLAGDVCRILGTRTDDIVKILEPDEYGKVDPDTIGVKINAPYGLTIVNEPGLYTLILRSRKEEARSFKRWVTHEVLPEIRKTGGYFAPRSFAEALQLAANQQFEIEAKNREIAKMEPVVQAHELLTGSKGASTISQVAKVLGFGQKKFFERLRKDGLLMTGNLPYQQYIDAGYFIVKDTQIRKGPRAELHKQTFVTAKGESYLAKRYGTKKG